MVNSYYKIFQEEITRFSSQFQQVIKKLVYFLTIKKLWNEKKGNNLTVQYTFLMVIVMVLILFTVSMVIKFEKRYFLNHN